MVAEREKLSPEETWDTYINGLEALTMIDEPWYSRLRAAFVTALEIGYNRGYEDGRELQWGLVEAADERRARAK